VRVLPADDPTAVAETVTALRSGGVVVLPTETVYGLAVLPGGEDRLIALKDRPTDMPIAVLVADSAQVEALASVPPAAGELMAAHWPGPLTLVLPARDGSGTIGVRFPDHAFVRAVAAEVGPIATTSANRHGEPTPATAREAAAGLAGPVDVVIDGGPITGTASTVVDATVDPPVVLRAGPVQL
jgi:tRNA threonylcarbamoyl adenosine modification protein (Sua5/YciO/YrdC/YwlC family)